MIALCKHIFFGRTGPFAWFFLLYAVWGFYTLDKYGVHLDELTQRTIGMENNRFLSGRVEFEKVEEHKFFGPVWESICYLAEQTIFQHPLRDKILLRRAMLWTLFLLALWRLFLMGKRNLGWGFKEHLGKFQKDREEMSIFIGSLIPVFMVAFWPRMFAEAHYNSKDALFFCLMVFVFDRLDCLWRNPKDLQKGLLGATILLGVASTIRLSGLLVLVLAMGFLWMQNRKIGRTFPSLLKLWCIGLFGYCLGYVVSYPYLWFKGYNGLENIVQFVVHNPWSNGALFLGSLDPSRWYLMVWMGFTLSLWVLFSLMSGIILGLMSWIKNTDNTQHSTQGSVNQSIYFSQWVVFSFLLYCIVAKPILYDAWRHLLFLLLPIVLMAASGWIRLFNILKSLNRHTANTFALITLLMVCYHIFEISPLSSIRSLVTIHSPTIHNPTIHSPTIHSPTTDFSDVRSTNIQVETIDFGYQSAHVDFNCLGQQLLKQYPMQLDYWQQSNYQALQWILRQDTGNIYLTGFGESLWLNRQLLKSEDAHRLKLFNDTSHRYLTGNGIVKTALKLDRTDSLSWVSENNKGQSAYWIDNREICAIRGLHLVCEIQRKKTVLTRIYKFRL